MKMGHWASMLVLALFVALRHTAAGLPLREQLALAEKEEDTYAQIELSRRILETEPRDAALRARLAELWLSIDDLEMAESIVRDWKEAPAAPRARFGDCSFRSRGQKDRRDRTAGTHPTEHPEDLEMTRRLAGYLVAMDEQEGCRST